jgi:hypothetical protein
MAATDLYEAPWLEIPDHAIKHFGVHAGEYPIPSVVLVRNGSLFLGESVVLAPV